MIAKRVWQKGDRMDRYFEESLLKDLSIPFSTGTEMVFFHDVDPASPEGRRASSALGGRNRWAVIAMDGNDMGLQHRVASERWGKEPGKFMAWLREMSRSLDVCSRGACRARCRPPFAACSAGGRGVHQE